MGHSRPLFFFMFVFSTFNHVWYKFSKDWIRTTDPWYWKRPLCQLSHNHFPGNSLSGQRILRQKLLRGPTCQLVSSSARQLNRQFESKYLIIFPKISLKTEGTSPACQKNNYFFIAFISLSFEIKLLKKVQKKFFVFDWMARAASCCWCWCSANFLEWLLINLTSYLQQLFLIHLS